MPDSPQSPSHMPRTHDAGLPPCKEVIQLAVRVGELETDNKDNRRDIRTLLDFMAGMKMLLNLSIGGGFLSIINLILLLITLAQAVKTP